jgi:penicillin-binding protein 2
LGQPTGIELYESTGILASREYKESRIGENWYVGDTLQASIGQSYHLFTPLQLASYAATIAADGERYAVHILRSVLSADNGTILRSVTPEILSEVEADKLFYRDIKEGMLMASRYGSASYVFRNYEIPVCSKTGTAQVNLDEVNNAVFIAFAPKDDPEIALAVVVENGANGYYLAEVARDIFDWYFHRQTEPSPVPEGQLLP